MPATSPSPAELRVTLHARWHSARPDVPIVPEALDRLPGYVTRYAQTLGVTVRAVGGAEDHLHLLFDLPGNQTVDSVMAELQRATARFLQDVLGQRAFSWKSAYFAESVSADATATMTEYVAQNRQHHEANTTREDWEDATDESAGDDESLPLWLREAMSS